MTEISRRQFAVYLVAVVLVVLLGGRALRAAPAPTAAPAAAAFTPGGEPDGAAAGEPGSGPGATGAEGVEDGQDGGRVLVHVAGRVRRPGVYELAEGARIADALKEAGGGRPGADLDVLNLAAKLTDGQQVLVARRGAPAGPVAAAPVTPAAGGTASASSPAAPAATATININQADATQLEGLTGVGPAIAAKIVDYRTQNGPFKTVDDLAQVSGIGAKTLEGMRAQATL